MEKLIKSPLNYIGGKYKLLPQLLPLFPKNINTFVDLFCGGCNVGININANKIIFNDNLLFLIELYKKFLTLDADDIILHIESRIKEFNLSLTNEDGYKSLRTLYNKEKNPLDLFVLVAYSFNHQIRFNNSHEFNTSFGKERSSFNENMRSNLYTFLNAIHNKSVEFSCKNFEDVDLSIYNENDFIYCDPPYLITTGTYNDGKRGFTGWNENEEIKLLNILDNLNENNVKFALSNVLENKGNENKILKEWSKKYNIHHLNFSYYNSSYHKIDKNKNTTDEVLITNY